MYTYIYIYIYINKHIYHIYICIHIYIYIYIYMISAVIFLYHIIGVRPRADADPEDRRRDEPDHPLHPDAEGPE